MSVEIIEERGGGWVRLVLSRPPGNLLSLDMVRALADALEDTQRAGRPRKWVTIEGAGEDFSFGAMIQEHVPGLMDKVLPETHAVFRRMLALPAPTAALVQGRCLGGAFELALTCDVVIATEDASLGLPEINLGAFPPAGAALLPLRAGANRAVVSMITGEPRSAPAWQEAGVIEVLARRGELIATAARWFETHLAPRSAVALGAAAAASRVALRSLAEPALAAAEKLYLDRVLPSVDAGEGIRAFIEKRPPRWKDQ